MAYSADTSPDGLDALTSVDSTDVFIVGDQSDSDRAKKITKANLVTDLADETQTLTNKTINIASNTLTGVQAEPVEGAFVDGDKTKLDGIETAADVTDTTNVTAAGALMDSEVTNLAQVKAFDTTDYATAAQGATADTAIQPADNVTQLDGTADRVLYIDSLGDVTELALGASGTYLKSQGLTSAPTWATPAGSGDVSKVGTPVDDQVGVWTGDGTIEGTSGLTKTATQFTAGNFVFNSDQTVGAGQDNYVLTYDNGTGEIGLEASAGGGSGDVVGPASATNNAIVRFDTTTGKLVQDSAVTIEDTTGDIIKGTNTTWGLNMTGDSNANTNIGLWTHSNSAVGASGISAYQARGTEGAESASQSGDWLMVNTGRGYGATGFPAGSKGRFVIEATENWTDAAQGTAITFHTTPNTTTTTAEQAKISDAGVNVVTGNGFLVNDVEILNATTLGSSVVNSSLTSVGTLSSGNVDAAVTAASATTAGKVELATIAETDTGTDTTRAVTPDGLQGSIRNLRFIDFVVVDPSTDVATGTGLVTWSAPFAGTIIQDDTNKDYFAAYTTTAGTTGTMVVDIHKGGTTIMTTNKLDIETTELDTTLATTQPDLTTTTFVAGDVFTIDVDAVHTTAAKGLVVRMAVRPD